LIAIGLIGYALALPRVTIFGATLDAHTLLVASMAILVGYQALWKETVVAAASAALFLGSNQVAGAEVGNTTGGTINVDKVLATHGGGLSSSPVIASAQVTTGQLLGDPANAVGGFCTIFAAAGTYDVSVQFKASSGTVTVNSRKLWVTTMALA